MVRSHVAPSCICGSAAVAISGHSSTSQSWKNALHARRYFARCSFSPSQARCVMSVQRIMIASALMSSGARRAAPSRSVSQRLLGEPCRSRRLRASEGRGDRRPPPANAGRAVRLTVAPSRSRNAASSSSFATSSASVAWPGSCDQTATRSSRSDVVRGGGRLSVRPVSAGSGPASTSSASARSAADRAIGPSTEMSVMRGRTGQPDRRYIGHSAQVGLWPNTPQ